MREGPRIGPGEGASSLTVLSNINNVHWKERVAERGCVCVAGGGEMESGCEGGDVGTGEGLWSESPGRRAREPHVCAREGRRVSRCVCESA